MCQRFSLCMNDEDKKVVQQYMAARQKLDAFEQLRRELEADVARIAMDFLSATGGSVFYENLGAKLVVQLRTKKPEHQDIDTLNELIQLEVETATRLNKQQIEELETELALINSKLDELKLTDEGRKLSKERAELVKQLTEKVPVIQFKTS